MAILNKVQRVASPFKIDWNNLAAVIEYANTFGPGHVVKKHDDRANYNICHAERRDLWDRPGVHVLHRT